MQSIQRAGGRLLAALFLGAFAISSANATVIYNSWTSNELGSPNYIVTVAEDGSGGMDFELTIDPWNAEALGVFVDLGDLDVPMSFIFGVDPGAPVTLVGVDSTSQSCGSGCGLNGLNPPVADPDGEWEFIFRLANQGFDGIQSFNWSVAAPGQVLAEASLGVMGLRSQVYCSGGGTIDGGASCGGSDKSYGFGTPVVPPPPPPVDVSAPGSVALLGAGFLALSAFRRRTTRL